MGRFGIIRSFRWSSAAVAFLGLAGCAVTADWPLIGSDDSGLFYEAYSTIADYYIEPVTPETLALAGLRNLASADAGFSVERRGGSVILNHGGSSTRFAAPAPGDVDGWARLTDTALKAARADSPAIEALSVDAAQELLLDGSLTALDRFSHYSTPDVARERRASRDGFGGIGITVNTEADDIRIAEILPKSPADNAGLRVDDRIVAIDGVEVASLPRSDIVQRLRGATDTAVTVQVERAGAPQRLAFVMRRMFIVPPSVTLTEEARVARLRIANFNQQTAQSVADLLKRAHQDLGPDLRGIILDLRGNPGGLLDQSIEVVSLFIDGGPVTSTIGRARDSIQHFSAPRREVERLPLAVLVNGGSASASEIVASALQDDGRAVVIGSASYGKGTVQNVQHLPNDGELTITWARLITPGGYVLHEHGVVPTLCTADLPDDARAVAAVLKRDLGGAPAELNRPRASLDEAGWKRLRALCPGQREDHRIDVLTAERLLADPALYAIAVRAPTTLAARPVATAGMH